MTNTFLIGSIRKRIDSMVSEAKPNKGGQLTVFAVSIITPPLLTLNMRETEKHESDVKINNPTPCIRCGYTYCGCWR